MKERKYIPNLVLILLTMFFLTGCSVTYDIEIYNDKINDELGIVEKNNNILNKTIDVVEQNTEPSSKIQTYRDILNQESKRKTQVYLSSSDKFYDKKIIDKKNEVEINYKYNSIPLDEYKDSMLVNTAFRYFTVYQENEYIVLMTSKGTELFKEYKYLDEITINLKTNHKVKENNADEVDGYHYTWKINNSNCNDKLIYIKIYKDKYILNYEGRLTKILIGGIILAFLIIIVIIFFKRKANKNNKI